MTEFRSSIATIQDSEFEYLKDLIYKKTGIFLAPHKKIMVQSRLNVRLRVHNLNSFEEYVQRLKSSASFLETEITDLINRITTNKTDFFRENHHFEFLKDTFFPYMEEESKKTGNKKIRIWCSASSTGEEPYSIAITALEFFGGKPGWNIKIIASDIDTNVIQLAKTGIYKFDRLDVVSENMKQKYFTKSVKDNVIYYEAKPNIKSLIEYKKINLLEKPYPLGEKMDLIFCRNVIIYFDKPTQKQLFSNFEEVLCPFGYLIIGHSETMFGISDKYKFLGHTIYQKKV
ncbi:CheR family methyltransferase [Leptospira sp. GIMC2001]|uniref:CheR family methyltransferase n=1 Tax=Leptospira sp. GIMC2001 TaxID=1513297 RepID=UPI00234B406B|nr:protein-glutamate O-methyltransferase CheR [Leptospira sp. GIMC2001]WCL47979.1 protein-glutamate O-methyltransferase CheR [Leptospira sp. GIMC2001]